MPTYIKDCQLLEPSAAVHNDDVILMFTQVNFLGILICLISKTHCAIETQSVFPKEGSSFFNLLTY